MEPLQLKLGMSPISWSNDDLPELGGDTSLETCLRETRLAGYTGTETGGKFPKGADQLHKVLQAKFGRRWGFGRHGSRW